MIMSSITLACLPPITITRKKPLTNPTHYFSYSIPIKTTTINLRLTSCKCTTAISSSKPNWVKGDDEEQESVFVVVNFYRFVFIKDPEYEVSKHLQFLQVPIFLILFLVDYKL